MVRFHCPTPIPTPIPILIPIQMANIIIMCKTVSTEPTPISILMQMGTVPYLAPILVPIRWNLTNFHCNFYIRIGPSGAFVHFVGIGIGIGVGQWKHTIRIYMW